MAKENQADMKSTGAKQKSASLFPPLYNQSNEDLEENSCSSPFPPIYDTDDADEE